MVDKYADAGVKLNALYSDEMHIQQDWDYFGHHDHGQFAMRYVSPGLAARYAELYGAEYADFAKYMVYFAYGQEDQSNDLSAGERICHVVGPTPEDARRTELFRARYFKLLQDGVVDLFVAAKRHAEMRMGHKLESRAHATWAESPTIDNWRAYGENIYSQAYEYTPNFVWSNTVHQAAFYGQGVLRIPDAGLPAEVKAWTEGARPGSRGAELECERTNGVLAITVTPEASGRWIYVTPAS